MFHLFHYQSTNQANKIASEDIFSVFYIVGLFTQLCS